MLNEYQDREIVLLEKSLRREKGIRILLVLVILSLLAFILMRPSHTTIEIINPSANDANKNLIIQKTRSSGEYLKKVSKQIYKSIFIYTPYSAKEGYDILLELAAPEVYGDIEKFVAEQLIKIRENNLSSFFMPTEFEINESKQSVVVHGRLKTFTGNTPVINGLRSYRFDFVTRNYALHLLSVIDVTGDNKPFDVQKK